MLSVRHLCVQYATKPALDSVELQVSRGELVSLVGPNGCGKSTLLHAVVGLIPSFDGAILVSGHAAGTPTAKRAIGFVPDDLPMPLNMSGVEYVNLFAQLMQAGSHAKQTQALFALFDIEHAQHDAVSTYSHGMKKKLQIIAALAHRPQLLILDEPLRALDPLSIKVLMHFLQRFAAQGGAVLFTNHDVLNPQFAGDRAIALNQGRIVGEWRRGDVRSIEALYFDGVLGRALLDEKLSACDALIANWKGD